MKHSVLTAVPRGETTKGELNAFRRAGKIPAVIYGGGSVATAILLDGSVFEKATAGISESAILTLDVAGKQTQVFVKEHQRNTLSGEIIHVDFLEIVKGRVLHAKVPLHLVGVPIGVREGGILENPAHEIEVECESQFLPERVDIDVSGLGANHSIHVRDIPAIEGVKFLTSPELVVAVVKFLKAEVVEVAAVAAVPAEGAAPAAGAAAPGAAAPAAEKADKKEEKK